MKRAFMDEISPIKGCTCYIYWISVINVISNLAISVEIGKSSENICVLLQNALLD